MFVGRRERLQLSGIVGRLNKGGSDEVEDGRRLMEVPTSYCGKWRREYSRKTSNYHRAWRVKSSLKAISI